MLLKIHQRNSDKNNTIIYRKALQFFADELLSKSKQKDLELTVIIKNFKPKFKHLFGQCDQKTQTHYVMEINKKKAFHEIICTMAHEMIHIKQGIYGKLLMNDEGFVWNGKMYKNVDMKDNDVYTNTPWESEANKLELVLTKKFFKTVMIEEVKNI